MVSLLSIATMKILRLPLSISLPSHSARLWLPRLLSGFWRLSVESELPNRDLGKPVILDPAAVEETGGSPSFLEDPMTALPCSPTPGGSRRLTFDGASMLPPLTLRRRLPH